MQDSLSIWDKWDPRDYNATYFSALNQDEEAALSFLVKKLKKIKGKHDILEFGCGPTITQVIPVVPYAKKIYLADYLPDNLREIQSWINKDKKSFSWNLFTKKVLELEGKNSHGVAVNEREDELREKIQNILECDASSNSSIKGLTKKFEILLSFFCADSATESKEVWEKYMQNILNNVASGGHVFLGLLHEANFYMVGNKKFPSANITQQDLTRVLINEGFDLSSFEFILEQTPLSAEFGFNSVLFAYARKSV